MATFQSQINILAAGQHQLHKKIEEFTNSNLGAKYDSTSTTIYDNNTKNGAIVIEGLGYQSFDCILTVNGTELHFMNYKGLCEDFTLSGVSDSAVKTISIADHDNDDSASISETELKLFSKTFADETVKQYNYPKIIDLTKQPSNEGKQPVTEGINPPQPPPGNNPE